LLGENIQQWRWPSALQHFFTQNRYAYFYQCTILQPTRWDEIITKTREKGEERNLSNRFIDKLFKAIHEEFINKQTRIMNNGASMK